jgi:thiol-disulfide isomerase/thioredoxin
MTTGLWVLAAAIVVAIVVGLVLRARNGKLRTTKKATVPAEVLATLDGDVTLVMFTTEFCANCKYTRPVLRELAADVDGVTYAEIDLTDQPELAKQVSVLSTPTTLAVAASGIEILRVGGVPKRDELLDALRPHLRIS